MNRSHSRHSHPLDKAVPKMVKSKLGYKHSSTQRQVAKKMHKKKQRQHNAKLADGPCQEI